MVAQSRDQETKKAKTPSGVFLFMPVFTHPKNSQHLPMPQAQFDQIAGKPFTENDDLPEDYDACADFSRSRYTMSTKKFWVLRGLINAPLIWVSIYTAASISSFKGLLFYESEWGVFLTFIAVLLMLAATFDKRVF